MNLFEIYFFYICFFLATQFGLLIFVEKFFDIMCTLLLVWLFCIRLHAEDKANNMI